MSDASPEKPSRYARLPAGKTIGGYMIESVIGEGAHAVVYLARRERPPATTSPEDSVDEAPASDKVALKVIHRHLCGDPQIYQRFHREAAILARLHGEHVVKLFESIEEDGLLTIALEHVEGASLEARLREAPLAVSEALEITLQICAALGAAHAAGIVHRDLKPANVLVTATRRAPSSASASDPPTEVRVKVVDFGLARLVHGDKETTSLTEQGMIFGSAEYMAPEQARGDEADARSDLYAAGVMLFEMAVGELPFKGHNALAMMAAHVSEPPPPPRSLRPDGRISAALEAIILRALAKDPADRYASARAFAEAIASAARAPLVIAPPRDADLAELGAGDTDLHLAPPSLAMARTIPTMEISAETRAEIAAQALAETATPSRPVSTQSAPTQPAPTQPAPTQPAPTQPAPTQPAPTQPAPADPSRPSGAGLPRLTSLASIPDTMMSPVYDPPSRSRWLWAVVAILAAAVGVVIGAIAGAR